MLNQSGFARNDEKKFVEVDCDEVWNAYAEYHSDAVWWRDKSFTKFNRLRKVFGKDRATENSALAPVEMVLNDDDEASESNIPDVQLDGSHHTDQTQAQFKSSSSRNKRTLDEGDDRYEYVTTLLRDHRSRG
ncbi:hypothetical protein L3X38_017059 [Prunus dulcis]|uniref:Uncharacterized protein n=1 Tax=Prunus dulcis TaxID=3755 RepID=A0AAD4W6K4_PRUDU|nr:hypothetical protein L3X38_017059 [Prunus dulcis]